MTKQLGKKSAFIMVWLSLCLFAPVKSAYPYCLDLLFAPVADFFPTYGCFDYMAMCTTEMEALDIMGSVNAAGFSPFVTSGEDEHGACYVYTYGYCIAITICYTEWDPIVNVPEPPPSDPNICEAAGGTGGGDSGTGAEAGN